ncbi:hypothetical protein BGX38DRAFT_1221444, partial [Terfezia claveryi]
MGTVCACRGASIINHLEQLHYAAGGTQYQWSSIIDNTAERAIQVVTPYILSIYLHSSRFSALELYWWKRTYSRTSSSIYPQSMCI